MLRIASWRVKERLDPWASMWRFDRAGRNVSVLVGPLRVEVDPFIFPVSKNPDIYRDPRDDESEEPVTDLLINHHCRLDATGEELTIVAEDESRDQTLLLLNLAWGSRITLHSIESQDAIVHRQKEWSGETGLLIQFTSPDGVVVFTLEHEVNSTPFFVNVRFDGIQRIRTS